MVGCGWGASEKLGCERGARTAVFEALLRHSARSRRGTPSKTAQAVVRFAATQASRYCTDPKAARRPVCDFVRRVVVPAGDLAIASVPSTPTYRRSGEHAIDGRPTEEAAGPAWRTGPRRGHADRAWRPARPRGSARRRSRQLRDLRLLGGLGLRRGGRVRCGVDRVQQAVRGAVARRVPGRRRPRQRARPVGYRPESPLRCGASGHRRAGCPACRLSAQDHPQPDRTSRRLQMTAPPIALRADLNNEDDEGYNWSLLRHADEPSAIVEGAVLVAGTARFWSWVRIRRVDDDGQVHFERISAEEAARALSRAS